MTTHHALRLVSLAALSACFATPGCAQADEGGYFKLGRYGFTSTTVPAGTRYASADDLFSGSGAVSVRDANPSKPEVITVVGHADRLDSTAYNQTLSEQRAELVKAYLVNTGGISGSKITASGKSEFEPVTLPDACKGNKPTAKLIARLQPDRGVVIEVTGSR